MRLSWFRFDSFIILLALAYLTAALPAFGDAGLDSGRADAGGRDGSAGTSSTGGRSTTGGGDAHVGTGGRPSGSTDAGNDARTRDASEPTEGGAGQSLPGTSAVTCGPLTGTPGFDAAALPSCTDVCPLGACVQAGGLPNFGADFQNCTNSADKCLPRFLIDTELLVRFKSCHSIHNAEGRCLPTCLALVAGQALPVPRDVCEATEACIPCFNPIDGSDNGVCSYACDRGPQSEPATLPACCATTGFCIEADILPTEDRSRLEQETCGPNELCAPKDTQSPLACEIPGEAGPPAPGSGGAPGTGGTTSTRDAGADAATKPAATDDSGCGCRVSSHGDRARAPLWMAVAALFFMRRRRTTDR